MTPVRLEPAALLSRVKHSTTESLSQKKKNCHLLELIVTLEALPIIIKHSGNTQIKFHADVPCSSLKLRGYSSVKAKTEFAQDLRRMHFR